MGPAVLARRVHAHVTEKGLQAGPQVKLYIYIYTLFSPDSVWDINLSDSGSQ